jgi:hypothetical protein
LRIKVNPPNEQKARNFLEPVQHSTLQAFGQR